MLTALKPKLCEVSSPTNDEICGNVEGGHAGCSPRRNRGRPDCSLPLLSLELHTTGALSASDIAQGVLRTESASKLRPWATSSGRCALRNCSCSSTGDTISFALTFKSAVEEPVWR